MWAFSSFSALSFYLRSKEVGVFVIFRVILLPVVEGCGGFALPAVGYIPGR